MGNHQRGFSLPLSGIFLIICAAIIWFFGWLGVVAIVFLAILMSVSVAVFEDNLGSGDDDWPSEIEFTFVLSQSLEEMCKEVRLAFTTGEFTFAENAFNEYWTAESEAGWKIILSRTKNEPDEPVYVRFKRHETGLEEEMHERFGSLLAECLGVEVRLRYEPAWVRTSTFSP